MAIRFKAGQRFQVALDVVKDATGYPVMRGVGFLWSAHSGGNFVKGDVFEIESIEGHAFWVRSDSPRVDGQKVVVFKDELREALKAGMAVQVSDEKGKVTP